MIREGVRIFGWENMVRILGWANMVSGQDMLEKGKEPGYHKRQSGY